MRRDSLAENHGMLFVYGTAQVRSFWMRNTYLPLDIAYMDSQFRIIDILQMEPETTEGHDSSGPAMFALEVRQGWFAERGIEVGAVAVIVFGG
jgi:uncharacterized membrane protein (UPF0127 family)